MICRAGVLKMSLCYFLFSPISYRHPACHSGYLSACLPVCLFACLLAWLLACLVACLHGCLLAWLLACSPTSGAGIAGASPTKAGSSGLGAGTETTAVTALTTMTVSNSVIISLSSGIKSAVQVSCHVIAALAYRTHARNVSACRRLHRAIVRHRAKVSSGSRSGVEHYIIVDTRHDTTRLYAFILCVSAFLLACASICPHVRVCPRVHVCTCASICRALCRRRQR
jgi:hypothetical protein